MRELVFQGAVMGREGNYGILFPDFMGCISAGETPEDAVRNGHEALQFHIEGMEADGDIIPAPREHLLAEVEREFWDEDDPEPDNWIGLFPITVLVAEDADMVAVPLRAALVRKIADASAASAEKLRSHAFIELAVEHELERYRKSA